MTLHGTGIHPGGITERFPLMVSALSGSITPRAGRGVLRHPHLRAPDVIRDWMLFGKTPEEARGEHHADASSATASGSRCGMVADELGFDLDPELRTHPRDGGRDRADRLARSGEIQPGRSPRSGSFLRVRVGISR